MEKLREIAVRAAVTYIEAALGVLLASGLTDLNPEAAELAAVSGLAAGLSVLYNASRDWLDKQQA